MKLDANGYVQRSDQTHSVGFPPPPMKDYGFDVISEAYQTHPYSQISARAPQSPGPSTYLHAGASSKGWPYDQKAEDTFDLPDASEAVAEAAFLNSPVFTPEASAAKPHSVAVEYEYVAVYGYKGEARLVKRMCSDTTIAYFDTMADARTAAEALNNHEGY